jgi:ABC-type antimicrobial peptide transport system permease subunit
MFYVPLAQNVDYQNEMLKRIELQSHFIRGIMLVTNEPPGVIEPLVTRTLSELDPDLTITSVRTMQQQVELSFDQERAVASLAGLFGIVALSLAAVGLYGVTAYTVAQRTNEIGIRMALGADRAGVVQLVMRAAFMRVVAGLILGLPMAVGAGRLIAGAALRRVVLGSARPGDRGERARGQRICRRDDPGGPRGLHFPDERAPDRVKASDSTHGQQRRTRRNRRIILLWVFPRVLR